MRESYLGITRVSDVPLAHARSEDTLREASIQGYAKLVRMAGLSLDYASIPQCVAGARPDAQFAADIAASLLEARHAWQDLAAGRNIFGFDVTMTPA